MNFSVWMSVILSRSRLNAFLISFLERITLARMLPTIPRIATVVCPRRRMIMCNLKGMTFLLIKPKTVYGLCPLASRPAIWPVIRSESQAIMQVDTDPYSISMYSHLQLVKMWPMSFCYQTPFCRICKDKYHPHILLQNVFASSNFNAPGWLI